MKVLLLAPPLKNPGGIQRYVRTLARALEDLLGRDCVRVVILDLPKGARDPAARVNAAGAKVRFVLAAVRETAAWRPDLIICAHVGLAPVAWVLRKVGAAPYWVVAHGIDVWGRLSIGDHRALVHADRVVAVSEFTRAQMVGLQGVLPERTSLLPPCLDTEWLAAATSHATGRLKSQRPTLLTVSRLWKEERYKGHDVVLRALPRVRREMPDVLYVIVGDGDDRPRLEELVLSAGLKDAVRFPGVVSAEALKAYYRDCDIFLMPARTVLDKSAPKGEGFGIVFLEAMAFGKPVIAPAFGAPGEFIHHRRHGLLVNPEDSDEVACALIELLRSPQRAQEMGAAAREWVQREYCYARFCERLRRLFEGAGQEDSRQSQCVC